MRYWKPVALFLLVAVAAWAVATPIHLPWPGKEGFNRKEFRLGLDLKGGTHLVLEADLSQLGPEDRPEEALAGAIDIIQRRVNAYGVTEPTIQSTGGNRLIVQLPGVRDVNEAVKLIGQTAQLDFREPKLDDQGNVLRNEEGGVAEWLPAMAVLNGEQLHLTGKYLKRRNQVALDPQTNAPIVQFEWDETGAKLFEQITTRLLEKPVGIFMDNELISGPTVRAVIKDRGIIEGLTLDEARLLAIQLNAGALPVPLKIVKQQDVDATLGADSLKKSLIAGFIGFAAILAFMLAYYRLPGVIAGLALLYYGLLVLAVFKLFPVTLTLAGIAGFILSLGMAVDANVLIFERTKEELRGGKTLRASIDLGFNRAWPAIRDSNITTFIACGILYWFGGKLGVPAVTGFALTLFIGVATSMFTAITVSRRLLHLLLAIPRFRRPSLFRI